MCYSIEAEKSVTPECLKSNAETITLLTNSDKIYG